MTFCRLLHSWILHVCSFENIPFRRFQKIFCLGCTAAAKIVENNVKQLPQKISLKSPQWAAWKTFALERGNRIKVGDHQVQIFLHNVGFHFRIYRPQKLNVEFHRICKSHLLFHISLLDVFEKIPTWPPFKWCLVVQFFGDTTVECSPVKLAWTWSSESNNKAAGKSCQVAT